MSENPYISPVMTWEEIKNSEDHRIAIKRQAIMFWKSKETVFAEQRPMERWNLCVKLTVDTWLYLGPQKDHVPHGNAILL